MARGAEQKVLARTRRRARTRKKIFGTNACPRLAVFRSHRHLYGQLIDDATGRTLSSASTLDKALRTRLKAGGTVVSAVEVGKLLGQRAVALGVQRVVFDRAGYRYHGRVKALAEGARASGLQF